MSGTGEAVVRVEHVTKRFGDTVAIDDLHLSIAAGEFVTFLGPSGCGKSSTLRVLGGFERADSGRILLDGRDVTDVPPNRRDVNMVFQDYALFPHMTVAGNIAFGLELKGDDRGAIRRRTDELLAFLELEDFRDRKPDELSGGQRQRVALARALARDPKLLLLDEPLGALDARLRAQVQLELKDIHRRSGKTFVFVTHDQEEALTMSDRIVVMRDGRIEQDGTPEALYLRPANRFVASFIGETNFIEGTLRGRDGDIAAIDWNGTVVHGTARGETPAVGASVSAAVRPESVRVHASEPPDGTSVPGRIVGRLFKGSRTAIDIETGAGGSGDRMLAYLEPELAARIREERVWIDWEPDRLAVLA